MCESKPIWQRSHKLFGREVYRCQRHPHYWIGLMLVLISSAIMSQGIIWSSSMVTNKLLLILIAGTAGFLMYISIIVSVKKELFLIMRDEQPDVLLNCLNLCSQAFIWGAIIGYLWFLVAKSVAVAYLAYFIAYAIGWLVSGFAETIYTIRQWYTSTHENVCPD